MTNFKEHPAFLQMSEQKQSMILLLAESLENKKLTEALPILVAWKEKIRQDNITFTPEENAVLTEIFTSKMNPAQRMQYEKLKPLMKN